jgi:uncharacterized protein YwgA
MKSNDQMMLLFETVKQHGYLRQEIVHSLVYLMKGQKILPFEEYEFSRYFMPFSKRLQLDIDDAVDFKLLDKKLHTSSMAQWAYGITETGTAYVDQTMVKIPESPVLAGRVHDFVNDSLAQGPVVLLEKSYKSLNSEIMERLGK